MAVVCGKKLSRAEILERVGDVAQLAGVRASEIADGKGRGMRALDFYSADGLEFRVLPDRAMDISRASAGGVPLVWLSPTGEAAPAFYDKEGLGWLYGFFGGLLTTCGLAWASAPTTDEGAELGLHGRISYIPAEKVAWGAEWRDDDYVLWAQGEVHETRVFGDKLVLRRRIETTLGAPKLTISDRVTNAGSAPTPHMILYHINVGWPVVDATAKLVLAASETEPRDPRAEAESGEFAEFLTPQAGYAERVYRHTPIPDSGGMNHAALVNPALGDGGVGVHVAFRAAELPYMVEWKMMGRGEYVVGLEPANCLMYTRDKLRAEGALPVLEPGRSVDYRVEIEAARGSSARAALEGLAKGRRK